jgi:hypothetical protein
MATFKSGAQGLMTNCSFRGFNTGMVIDGSSANANYGSGDLEITNCEFVGWAGTLSEVLTSANEEAYDAIFTGAGNALTASPTKGSTANFDWTFSKSLGLLD